MSERGLLGNKGMPGPAGPSGLGGPTGPAGIKGPKGPVGSIGLTGPRGASGATGVAGPPGAKGLAGERGLQGSKGSKGVAGIPGPDGLPGLGGDQGPAGGANFFSLSQITTHSFGAGQSGVITLGSLASRMCALVGLEVDTVVGGGYQCRVLQNRGANGWQLAYDATGTQNIVCHTQCLYWGV